MSVGFILGTFLPTLVPLAAGYALARYLGVSATPLRTVLRYALAPPLLFALLSTSFQLRTWLVLLLIGAGMVAAVWYALPALARSLRGLEASPTVPAILVFTLPLLALSWDAKGAARSGAAIIFVGAAVTILVLSLRQKAGRALLLEPWLYGALLAILLKLIGQPNTQIYKAVGALAEASYPLALVYFGTLLHPFNGFDDRNAWLSAAARLGLALAVALVVGQLFALTKTLLEAAVLCALAPPVGPVHAIARLGDRDTGKVTVPLATSVVALLVLLLGPWFR